MRIKKEIRLTQALVITLFFFCIGAAVEAGVVILDMAEIFFFLLPLLLLLLALTMVGKGIEFKL